MKIFVTGCAGLLGANYTRHLISNGHHVIGIDDLSGGHKAFITKGENFEFVKLNFLNSKFSPLATNALYPPERSSIPTTWCPLASR